MALAAGIGCAGAGTGKTPPVSSPAPAPPVTASPPAAAPRPPPIDITQELALARTAHAEGRVHDESIHLERVVRADPNAFEARLEFAELLLRQSIDLGRAVVLLRDAQVLRPGDPRPARLAAWLAEIQGDDAAAAAAYQRALALDPDPELRYRRGILLRRLGRTDEAVMELERVASERPGDRAARTTLAELFELRGRLGDAEKTLLDIVQLAPAEPGPQRRLAAFYRRHGEAAKALEAETRARRLEGAPRSLRPLRPSKR
jgi:predicted Zn-dependent protease